MNAYKYQHIFGPVPSRRLGYSLGVDLVPYKTCTYDCIYCQLGRTTDLTTVRKEYAPLKDILREIDLKLKGNGVIDYITLSGSGEPTLFSRLKELISEIKSKTDIPVAVLTNGSLLWDKEVQNGLNEADLVIPSLDAGDAGLFQYVNRPHRDISFDKMTHGIAEFRSHFSKQLWLEVFLLGGVNAMGPEIEKISALTEIINPDKVQLNTVTRPPAEPYAYPVSGGQRMRIIKLFPGNTEWIADFRKIRDNFAFKAGKEEILGLLNRRPCTLDDISAGLHFHRNEVVKYIEDLMKAGTVITKLENNVIYYLANKSRQDTKI